MNVADFMEFPRQKQKSQFNETLSRQKKSKNWIEQLSSAIFCPTDLIYQLVIGDQLTSAPYPIYHYSRLIMRRLTSLINGSPISIERGVKSRMGQRRSSVSSKMLINDVIDFLVLTLRKCKSIWTWVRMRARIWRGGAQGHPSAQEGDHGRHGENFCLHFETSKSRKTSFSP